MLFLSKSTVFAAINSFVTSKVTSLFESNRQMYLCCPNAVSILSHKFHAENILIFFPTIRQRSQSLCQFKCAFFFHSLFFTTPSPLSFSPFNIPRKNMIVNNFTLSKFLTFYAYSLRPFVISTS